MGFPQRICGYDALANAAQSKGGRSVAAFGKSGRQADDCAGADRTGAGTGRHFAAQAEIPALPGAAKATLPI